MCIEYPNKQCRILMTLNYIFWDCSPFTDGRFQPILRECLYRHQNPLLAVTFNNDSVTVSATPVALLLTKISPSRICSVSSWSTYEPSSHRMMFLCHLCFFTHWVSSSHCMVSLCHLYFPTCHLSAFKPSHDVHLPYVLTASVHVAWMPSSHLMMSICHMFFSTRHLRAFKIIQLVKCVF